MKRVYKLFLTIILASCIIFLAYNMIKPKVHIDEAIWVQSFASLDGGTVWQLCADSSDTVYAAGNFRELINFNPGFGLAIRRSSSDFDPYLICLDNSGAFNWVMSIPGRNIPRRQDSSRVAICGDSIAWAHGSTIDYIDYSGEVLARVEVACLMIRAFDLDTEGNAYVLCRPEFLKKYDLNGNELWSVQSSGYYAIDISSQGNVYIGGQDLTQYNDKGEMIWSVSINGNVAALAIGEDGEIYCCGFQDCNSDAEKSPTEDNGVWFVEKYSENGLSLWRREFTRENLDNNVFDIEIDREENVYLTGEYSREMDFDPGDSEYILRPESGIRAFILKLNGDGEFREVWSADISSASNSIYITENDVLYAAGNAKLSPFIARINLSIE